MRLRAAGLLDLSRIEEMHRSADMTMNGADAPAARLWSLLSSTLSAFLPLAQETLIYVAEEGGKVVGYVPASGSQRGLELSRAKVLQVLNLQVVDGASAAVPRARGEHPRELVVARVEILGGVKVERSCGARQHTLNFLAMPERPLSDELADLGLSLLAGSDAPAWSSLRHYDSHMIDALRGRGFSVLLTQLLLVKELAVRVPVREKGLVPSLA